MTITILDFQVEKTQSAVTTLSATLNGVTGTDVAIVVSATARTVNTTFSISGITWDGTTMTVARNQQADLNAFPRGIAHIAVLPIGNPSGITANAVMTITTTQAMMGMTVFAVQGIDQTTPIKDTDGNSVISAASSTSRTLTTAIDDIIIDCLTCAASQTATPGAGQTKIANETTTSPTGTHASSYKLPVSAGTTMVSWSWTNSSFVYAAVSFLDSGFIPTFGPVITSTVSSKGTNGIIDVRDTNITINGTDLLGTVNTVVYYADTSVFATTLKVQWPIDSVTDTSINVLEPRLGVLGRGNKFLFVVTNEGEGDEEISPGFAVQVEGFVTAGADDFSRNVHVTNGSTGNQTIVTGLSFTPKAAIIVAIETSNLDSVDADAPSTICLVATNTSMGDATTSKSAGGTVLRRKQASGTGSLIVMDASSTSAPDFVTGTPVLTATGLDINFTVNTSGIRLYISFLGGDSVTASVNEVQISAGSLTGLSFQPELLIGTSVGLTQGSSGDNTFSLRTWGFANATDQCLLGFTNISTRNCTAKSGSFLGQLVDTSFTWEMVITALTSDGFTWTGSNTDNAYVLSLNLGGKGTFIGQFATSSNGTDGMSENLPDVGFDPELMVIMTAHRTTESVATAVGGRHSIGSCTAELDNRCTTTKFLPSTGGGTAEQFQSESLILAGGASSGAHTFTGEITVFGQISTILYPLKTADAILLHILAFEKGINETIATDGDSAHVAALFSGEDVP